MIVLRSEGAIAGNPWKHLAVVSDERVVWFELIPALLAGWNVKRSWVHGAEAWPGMTADQIVAWKDASGYPMDRATAGEAEWAIAKAAEVAL